MFKALVWDFGGTLFDTFPGAVLAIQKALNEDGISADREEIYQLMKKSVYTAISYYRHKNNLSDDFAKRVNQYDSEIKIKDVKPMPCAGKICRYSLKKGVKNFIISHRNNSLFKYLSYYGMKKLFTEIVTSESNLREKPDPEGIVYIVNKYNLVRDEVLVIGDRDCDILAGKNAEVKTCRLISDMVKCEIEADFLIERLDQLYAII